MSLTLAYDIARSALSTSATSTSVVSRNVQNAGDPTASRKSADIVTGVPGGTRVAGISNAVDAALFESVLENTSATSELETLTSALDRLGSVVGDPELGMSPSALIADLQSALQTVAATPNDDLVARTAVLSAGALASGLNDAAALVGDVRTKANTDIANAVESLEGLLADFETTNNAIVAGTFAGRDVTDQVDQRNSLMQRISELVEVRSTVRPGNDMVVFLVNGATLFETVPRKISFDGGAALTPGLPGGTLTIDGVPVTGSGSGRIGGRIGGALQIRDGAAVTFGRQLDEIARGLIAAFAEIDQTATPTLPAAAGLFTYAGGPALPASGTVSNGLASTIRVNANVDPAQGGDVSRLRDGGIADPSEPAYVYNSTGGTGFGDRLRGMIAALSESQSFDASTSLEGQTSVAGLASDSAGWVEGERRSTTGRFEAKQVVAERAVGAWQDRVGINLDEELTALIALERSYQASSRLITTVNGMYDALLSATG